MSWQSSAERKGANCPTSESLPQAEQGTRREDSLLPELPKRVVKPTEGLALSSGAGRRTAAFPQLGVERKASPEVIPGTQTMLK